VTIHDNVRAGLVQGSMRGGPDRPSPGPSGSVTGVSGRAIRTAAGPSAGGEGGRASGPRDFCGSPAIRAPAPAERRSVDGQRAGVRVESRAEMKLRVLVNPKAGSGAGERRLPEVERALRRFGLAYQVVRTTRPGDAGELLRRAQADGVECVALVGGDGTLNEACQGYLDPAGDPTPGPDLALIPAGTGGDFRKTFELGSSVDEAVHRMRDSNPRPIDLGILEATAPDGAPIVRAFVNITSFGLGGLTDKIVNSSPKWMGGRAAFLIGAVRALAVYRNAPVVVRVDGTVHVEGPIVNVAVANGRYFGGGMKIAPNADPCDGLFDVVALGDLTRGESLGLTHKIYLGSHIGANKVSVTRGARVEAEPLRSRDHVLIDMDGETPGRLPLVARVAPAALRILV
jgi:diacylglycerol kinase (ATP)